MTVTKAIQNIGDMMDEMNDDQIQDLLESAENIVHSTEEKKDNKEKSKEVSPMDKPNVGNLTVATLNAIMDLDLEDRQELAPYFAKSKDELSRKLSEMMEIQMAKSSKYRNAQIEKLRDDPTVIWAAHAIDKMDTLVKDLMQIVDSAKESIYDVEEAYNSTGYYKMLLNCVDGIVRQMNECLNSNSEHDNIMGVIAMGTPNPFKKA